GRNRLERWFYCPPHLEASPAPQGRSSVRWAAAGQRDRSSSSRPPLCLFCRSFSARKKGSSFNIGNIKPAKKCSVNSKRTARSVQTEWRREFNDLCGMDYDDGFIGRAVLWFDRGLSHPQ